jgi:hypothetical protein
VGEIVSVTVVAELPPPHPNVPSAVARVSIICNFHRLIPVLPTFLVVRSSGTGSSLGKLCSTGNAVQSARR